MLVFHDAVLMVSGQRLIAHTTCGGGVSVDVTYPFKLGGSFPCSGRNV